MGQFKESAKSLSTDKRLRTLFVRLQEADPDQEIKELEQLPDLSEKANTLSFKDLIPSKYKKK